MTTLTQDPDLLDIFTPHQTKSLLHGLARKRRRPPGLSSTMIPDSSLRRPIPSTTMSGDPMDFGPAVKWIMIAP